MQRFFEALTHVVLATGGLPILVDSACKGLILMSVVGGVVLCMQQASAASRHWMWRIGIAGLLCLPLFSAILPEWHVMPSWMAVPVRSLPASATEWTIDRFEPPRSIPRDVSVRGPQEVPTRVSPANDVRTLSHETRKNARVERDARFSMSTWTVSIWLIGAVGIVIRLQACQIGLGLLKYRSRSCESLPVGHRVQALSRQLGIKTRIGVLLSDQRATPMTWGVWRPYLLVPAEFHSWPAERQDAVLLHELEHIRRGDCLTQLLTQLACALHWFNPLIWIAARRMEIECEYACDDFVLSRGVAAPDYAELLLDIGSRSKRSIMASTVSFAMARRSRLEDRICTILESTRNRRQPRRRILVLGSVVFLTGLLPYSMLRAVDGHAPDGTTVNQQITENKPRAAGRPIDPTRGEIHGTVLDAVTGKPVAGAYVGVGDFGDSGGSNRQQHREQGRFDSTQSDDQGHFDLTGLIRTGQDAELQAHWLIVRQARYVTHYTEVPLPPGESPVVEIRLTTAASAHVQVVDAAGNRQKGRYFLRVEALDGHEFLPPTSDPHLSAFASSSWMEVTLDGAFTFASLQPGAYRMDVIQDKSSGRATIEGYGGPIWSAEGARYHGGVASVELQAGQNIDIRIAPQDFGTRLVLALPQVAATRSQETPRLFSKPFVVISRNPKLIVWNADRYRSPEDPRLGRIQKNALLWGLANADHQLVIENLPPDTYAAFTGPVVALQGTQVALKRNDTLTIDVGWRAPDAVSQVGTNGLDNTVNLDHAVYSTAELLTLLSRATSGHPVLDVESGLREIPLHVNTGKHRLWELLEKLLHDNGWIAQESEGNRLTIRSVVSGRQREK